MSAYSSQLVVFIQQFECDFTKFDLICVEFLDSVSDHVHYYIFSAAIDNGDEIFYTSKLFAFPGRILLIRKDSIKKSIKTALLLPSSLQKSWTESDIFLLWERL